MAHMQQTRFMALLKQVFPDYFFGGKCLEVGSLDINGSVREVFVGTEYIGIDIAEGKGVDLVSKGEDFSSSANNYDVVISCECMEHNPNYQKTWLNMIRVLKEDGLLVMTCATFGRAQHGTSIMDAQSSPLTIAKGQEYYRNLTISDFELVNLDAFFSRYSFFIDYSHADLFFFGLGRKASNEVKAAFDAYLPQIKDIYNSISRDGIF